MLGLAAGGFSARGQQTEQAELRPTVLIIDSSGSMSERINGEPRLVAAREVIIESISGWRDDTQLAVLAYGHRRAGDCGDIETLMPLGPIDVAQTKTKLDALRARGKTPLSAALEQGAAQLPPEGGAIVLLSDGIETCDADPCVTASNLHLANPDIVIQVIGFDVKEEERRQLSCIAAGGGGRLFSAPNADQLTAALQVIGVQSGIAADAALPAKDDGVNTARVALRLLQSEGVPMDEASMIGPVAWTVEPMGQGGSIRISDLRDPSFALEPGRYRISARFGQWTAEEQVELAAGEQTVDLDLRLGRIVLEAAPTAEGPPLDAGENLSWEFAPAERPVPFQSVLSIARPTLVAQEGDYIARLNGAGETVSIPTKVVAGETVVARVLVPQAGS